MKSRIFLLLLFLAPAVFGQSSHPSKGHPAKSAHFPASGWAISWKALDWDSDTWDDFEGKPEITIENHQIYLIPRKRYVVNYDTTLINPIWVAHISTKESAERTAKRPNSDPAWKRPAGFSPDPFLKRLGRTKGIPFTTDDDFTGSNYSRGHMASNAEMKGFDQDSQIESFYLSNVVPQLQDHNGGIWAQLEADCLKWAKTFGKVYVITGPVFDDPDSPTKLTKGRGKNRIPVPDYLFKMVIVEKGGKAIAAGFLIPHKHGLKKRDLFKYQVPIDDVEKATGINFMPEMGEPNALEQRIDPVWKASLN